MKINDLYFGIMLFDPNTRKLNHFNLFQFLRVQHSIAKWATMSTIERSHFDALHFCFGDTCSRCEYEMLVQYFPTATTDPLFKVDTYTMYVEPNRDHLLELVSKISKTEGKRWLKENKEPMGLKTKEIK